MQCLNHPEVDQDIVRCLRCQQPYCPDCVVMLRGYWYCGPCKDETVRDIQSGTGGLADLASVGQRILAVLLDSLVQGVMMMVVLLPLIFLMGGAAAALATLTEGASGEAAGAVLGIGIVGIYALIFFLSVALPFVYEGFFLARNGQTPGKMALAIRVVDADGGVLSRGQAWGRAALKIGLGQACSCVGLLADDLPACFTNERAALHDMAARTRVVRG